MDLFDLLHHKMVSPKKYLRQIWWESKIIAAAIVLTDLTRGYILCLFYENCNKTHNLLETVMFIEKKLWSVQRLIAIFAIVGT